MTYFLEETSEDYKKALVLRLKMEKWLTKQKVPIRIVCGTLTNMLHWLYREHANDETFCNYLEEYIRQVKAKKL